MYDNTFDAGPFVQELMHHIDAYLDSVLDAMTPSEQRHFARLGLAFFYSKLHEKNNMEE